MPELFHLCFIRKLLVSKVGHFKRFKTNKSSFWCTSYIKLRTANAHFLLSSNCGFLGQFRQDGQLRRASFFFCSIVLYQFLRNSLNIKKLLNRVLEDCPQITLPLLFFATHVIPYLSDFSKNEKNCGHFIFSSEN